MSNTEDIPLLFQKNQKELANARETFRRYKELRAMLGKPSKSPFDPDEIKKNLSGEAFLSLIKEIEKKRED